jgi:hypothetical protein
MVRPVLAAAVLFTGCAGGGGAGSGGGGGGSPGEFTPRAAFRAYAARVLQVPPGEIRGGDNDAKSAAAGEHSRGGAWQYVMFHGGNLANAVRGWATADGTVITRDQNLGVLFAEAGVWARPPIHSATELANLLAEDLVWSYGITNELAMTIGDMEAPRLTLAADGSGTLRFFSNDHGGGSRPVPAAQAGPLGSGGAPADVYWENVVVLTADHKATLTQTAFTLHL